jgi:sulfite oxidase
MEHMMVGRLREQDQEAIDDQMAELQETSEDPYANEPIRHRSLRVHSDTPMNAEVPTHLLTKNYLTPASLFYIRHHHPVPRLTKKQVKNYKLTIDLTEMGKGVVEVSLEDIKKLPKVQVTATLQCSGNRRSGFNEVLRTSGTSWGQGAVSTADWGGARLVDVLKLAGFDDPIKAQEKQGMEHVRFFALDEMSASIGIEKAMNPYGDVIFCYEMNGEPLSRDHGFPLRALVPGYAAVRTVKWLKKLQLSKEEAEGPWQRGLIYKTLPPSVTDAKSVDLDHAPSMTEASLFSGITSMDRAEPEVWVTPGDAVMMKASGWAWAGGGRNIVRVDLSGDEGKTWTTATLTDGANQRFGRAWAWVFWEAEVPTKVKEDGSVHLVSKAVDLAFNVQPEKCDPIWNVRGLGNNSWYHATAKVTDTL